jgi:hypothetical protein
MTQLDLHPIIVPTITFSQTKRYQLEREWQQLKVNHYKELLSAISDTVDNGSGKGEARNREARERLALASNTVGLVAPQSVVAALMSFFIETSISNKSKSIERHDKLLKDLVLAIRKDIGLSAKDDAKTFDFHLIGS